MKYLRGYKLYESANENDPIISLIEDRLLDIKDIGAGVAIDNWIWSDSNGEVEIYNDFTEGSKAKRAYNVHINYIASRIPNSKKAYIHDDEQDRDADVIFEVINGESFEKSGRLLAEFVNFISMCKGEGWTVFMDESSISSRGLTVTFFIIP